MQHQLVAISNLYLLANNVQVELAAVANILRIHDQKCYQEEKWSSAQVFDDVAIHSFEPMKNWTSSSRGSNLLQNPIQADARYSFEWIVDYVHCQSWAEETLVCRFAVVQNRGVGWFLLFLQPAMDRGLIVRFGAMVLCNPVSSAFQTFKAVNCCQRDIKLGKALAMASSSGLWSTTWSLWDFKLHLFGKPHSHAAEA